MTSIKVHSRQQGKEIWQIWHFPGILIFSVFLMPQNRSTGDTYVKFSGLKKYLLYLKTAVRLFLNSVQVSQSEAI